MIKYLKILFLGMVVIGLMALPATAVDLRNRNGLSFGTGNSSANSYPIAFEAYSNAGGVSTIADDTTHKGLIEVALAGSLAVGDTVDLKISNGTAQFVSAGPTYRFGLCDPAKNLGACLPGAGSTGGIVGVVNSSGVVTADLGFNILTAVTGPITLWVIQWDDALGATANTIDGAAEGSSIKDGVGLSVNAGLTPSGCDSLPRFIKITFSTPHESSQAEKNFAFITPQFSISGLPATNSAQAELNTDFDFTQFVVGSGPFVSASEPEEINIPPAGPATFFTIVDISGPMWIAFVQNLVPVANLSFNVNSAVPEPCVTVEVIPQSTDVDTTPCTASIDNKTFSCTLSGLPLLDPFQLEFEVNCSADPTAWTFSNVNITSSNVSLCLPVSTPRDLGVWFGGLEAFVPFVKGDRPNGYSTVIKLFNRYNHDAKLFVSTFADVAGGTGAKIMISTRQMAPPLDLIPAGGFVAITDQDIQAFLAAGGVANPAGVIANGIPVKFNIRVPAQTGSESFSGTIAGTFTAPSTISGTTVGSETRINPNDPFVEGVVISNYPNGGQRSIALKFKSFKNGEYNF
jgi:hypothetical protein